MDMQQRTYALDQFRKRKSCILVVTDLAARGLDIPEVNYVVHYDYPSNHQIFVHRSGRTARAERQGHTIALMTYHELPYLIELATFVTKKLVNQSNAPDSINYGSVPHDVLAEYVTIVNNLKERKSEIKDHQVLANKAYEKFKKCRAEASQNSLKKAKNLTMDVYL